MENRIDRLLQKLAKIRIFITEAIEEFNPKQGEKYCYVDSCEATFSGSALDLRDILITQQKLIRLAKKLNNGGEINWSNFQQCKFYITLKNDKQKLFRNCTSHCHDRGNIYCLAQNFLEIAIKEIGEDLIVELIKSGV